MASARRRVSRQLEEAAETPLSASEAQMDVAMGEEEEVQEVVDAVVAEEDEPSTPSLLPSRLGTASRTPESSLRAALQEPASVPIPPCSIRRFSTEPTDPRPEPVDRATRAACLASLPKFASTVAFPWTSEASPRGVIIGEVLLDSFSW